MDFSVCTQCAVEIESTGIHFRNLVFCSDECCEEYDSKLAAKKEPVIDELVDEDLVPDDDLVPDEDLGEDLGYREDDDEDDPLGDDFDIKLEDF